jgi:hypothetical protein
MSQTTIPIVRSRRGLPCLWEEGGGFTNTGRATIIADSRGRRKRPIYIRGSGKLSCEQHALIPIEVGDIVVKASLVSHQDGFKALGDPAPAPGRELAASPASPSPPRPEPVSGERGPGRTSPGSARRGRRGRLPSRFAGPKPGPSPAPSVLQRIVIYFTRLG